MYLYHQKGIHFLFNFFTCNFNFIIINYDLKKFIFLEFSLKLELIYIYFDFRAIGRR